MSTTDHEAEIRHLRIPGLLRMIASADNRALKHEAEGKAAKAAEVRKQAQVYRAELARLTGQPPAQPAEEETAEAAAERVMAELQPPEVRHAALQREVAALRQEEPHRGPPPRLMRIFPGLSLRIGPMRSVGGPRASPIKDVRPQAP